jgi:hypothetical protein
MDSFTIVPVTPVHHLQLVDLIGLIQQDPENIPEGVPPEPPEILRKQPPVGLMEIKPVSKTVISPDRRMVAQQNLPVQIPMGGNRADLMFQVSVIDLKYFVSAGPESQAVFVIDVVDKVIVSKRPCNVISGKA